MSFVVRDDSLRTGLIGANIQRSRSPAIHTTEARCLGLNLRYELLDLDETEGGIASLSSVLEAVKMCGFLGVNVTFPAKQAIIPLLDELSDDAAVLGACNTVALHGGRAVGHNTDWRGFSESFRRSLPDARFDRVILLGAGGGASAVAYALIKMGAHRIAVHARRREQAEAFADRFNKRIGGSRVIAAKKLEDEVDNSDGIVNCTPVGMTGYTGEPFPEHLLKPDLWVSDLVYVPLRTRLLRAASMRGCKTLEGGGMVVFQAAEAFRIFTGIEPDKERMLVSFEDDVSGERSGL